MASKYKIPRGTYDILPQDSYKWQYVKNVFQNVAARYNYREIVTPIFERSDLFERSVGDTSDIVEKEMYKFQDKKGRVFALRPEGTAPVVRSFVENNLGVHENVTKLYYMGPMFRYDRPQKGRYRQFYQYGIENIGSNNPRIDAEVIAMGYTFLKELGLKNFVLEINSIGNENCGKDYDKALVEYFEPYSDKLCGDCRARLKKNPKRLLDCKVASCKEIAAGAPSMLDYLDEECNTDFEAVKKYLALMGIPYQVNPRIVRGLDYYTKTAFEFIDTNLGAQNTLIGGGRFDKLVGQIGGKDVPGIGYAGGFERLILSMEAEALSFGEQPKVDIFLVTLGEKAEQEGVKLLGKIRDARMSAEYAVDKHSMKAQMKQANKSGAAYVLILGEDELEQNMINLKNMETGEQQTLPLDEIIESLTGIV